jgi:hypothetical protein
MTIHRSIAVAVGASFALLPVAAFAHAHLDHANPAVGSTVTQPPTEVSLWFTEALEPKFSAIEVRDTQGRPVQAGPATLARDNTAQLRVPLKALPPGTYKVIWRVLSVDTHRTQGDFTFRVGP